MYVAGPSNSPLVWAADWRIKSDALDSVQGVLDYWKPGHALFQNKYQWLRVRRIAMNNWASKTRDAKSTEMLQAYLQTNKQHTHLIAMAPPPAGAGDEAGSSGSILWRALKAPGSAGEMQYTFWNPPQYPNLHVISVPYVWKRMKKIQEFIMHRTVLWARRGFSATPHNGLYIEPNDALCSILDTLTGKPLSVDIEAISSMNLIMAIGLSDGVTTVSVPWDGYPVYTGSDQTETEPPLTHRVISEKVLALLSADTPKIFHNASFDVPFLKSRGIPVGGEIHDTWAAHAVLFPGLPHGLQTACATVFPCPPWKTLAKAKWAARGTSPDDPKYWLKTGLELRKYNAEDAYYTALLARRLLPLLNANV